MVGDTSWGILKLWFFGSSAICYWKGKITLFSSVLSSWLGRELGARSEVFKWRGSFAFGMPLKRVALKWGSERAAKFSIKSRILTLLFIRVWSEWEALYEVSLRGVGRVERSVSGRFVDVFCTVIFEFKREGYCHNPDKKLAVGRICAHLPILVFVCFRVVREAFMDSWRFWGR